MLKRAPNQIKNLKNEGHHRGTSLPFPRMGVPPLYHPAPTPPPVLTGLSIKQHNIIIFSKHHMYPNIACFKLDVHVVSSIV